MYENLCQPCIMQPTRIVDRQKPSLIENIFINTIESPVSGNLIDKISDHFPNFIIIENIQKKKEKDADSYKRNTKFYDRNIFQNQLTENSKTVYNPNLDVNELSNKILETFTQILDINAPLKKMTKREIKNKQRPWITKGIIKSIQMKTLWLKRFMKKKG